MERNVCTFHIVCTNYEFQNYFLWNIVDKLTIYIHTMVAYFVKYASRFCRNDSLVHSDDGCEEPG